MMNFRHLRFVIILASTVIATAKGPWDVVTEK